ncbi:WD repeat-containing protein 91-like protein [Cucumis melo var. makuwa]|uniref:WD repeat-containing protein 91-like protein n=1 Tax=Cucumis melo var. makuwa TaxID=1194695 RepID=A0A5A7TMJ1_CUCMM|nr:WD repeat-containing protein 91-like protein [Cucumis melo var. makuwa]TYK05983.1 WD repeat-containing protein 91-like protein [Cucumis melo var. makuwa]
MPVGSFVPPNLSPFGAAIYAFSTITSRANHMFKLLYKAHFLDIHFQLGDLRRNFVLLKDINDNQETSLRYCETKLQNVVLGYLSWGRLFFFGVSFSFKCKDWWVILALTLFYTFFYFLLFMDAVIMLSRTHDQLDIIRKELAEICQQILVAQNQDNVGLSMEAGEDSDGFELSFHERMFMLDQFRVVETGRKVYIYFIVCPLLAITAIELYACKCLLCN